MSLIFTKLLHPAHLGSELSSESQSKSGEQRQEHMSAANCQKSLLSQQQTSDASFREGPAELILHLLADCHLPTLNFSGLTFEFVNCFASDSFHCLAHKTFKLRLRFNLILTLAKFVELCFGALEHQTCGFCFGPR